MSKTLLMATLVLGLAACTGGSAKDLANDGTTGTTAGSKNSGDRTTRTTLVGRTLASGTRVDATTQQALSSRTNKPGESLRAIVSADVKDARGAVVIPAGSDVALTIEQLEPGSDQVRPEGRLSLAVRSVSVNGRDYPLSASLAPVSHRMVGRGVTTDEAERIGAGTAVGAAIGQVIGKNTRSTVIGGAVGAVAGGAVAVRYAYRDVVVSAGTPISFTLTQSLNVSAR